MRNKTNLSRAVANELLGLLLDQFDEWRASGNEDYLANLRFVEVVIRQEKERDETQKEKPL